MFKSFENKVHVKLKLKFPMIRILSVTASRLLITKLPFRSLKLNLFVKEQVNFISNPIACNFSTNYIKPFYKSNHIRLIHQQYQLYYHLQIRNIFKSWTFVASNYFVLFVTFTTRRSLDRNGNMLNAQFFRIK